jgi:hypothetical protein
MQFDPNVYAQIAAQNPVAAQQYLESFQGITQGPPAPAVPAAAPQAQPQGYSNPAAVQPQQQLARGTLEDFYNQPSGGGAPSITSKFFNKRPQGSWLKLEVVRDVTNTDVRQQTTPQGQPQVFRDGKPKFVLVVPVKVVGSSDNTHYAEFPDGEGSLWVKGVLADEVRRAMTAAGDPSGYPKGGAVIVMQSAGEKASRTPGFSPTKLYSLQYAGPVASAAEQIANPPAQDVPAASPTVTSAPVTTPPADLAHQVIMSAPPAPNGVQVPTAAAVPIPGASAPVPADVPAANFTPPTPPAAPQIGGDKAALLARLQGGQQG